MAARTGDGEGRELGGFFGLAVEEAERYVRYLAWLDSTPEKQKKTRRQAFGADSVEEPESAGAWLVHLAQECGLTAIGSFGVEPISWADVAAWAESVGEHGRWVRIMVRRLSMAYVEQYSKSSDPACPSPLVTDIEERRAIVRNQLKRFIQARS